MYDKNYRMYKHTHTYWHSNALKGHEKKKLNKFFEKRIDLKNSYLYVLKN